MDRNTILFIALSALLYLAWNQLVLQPSVERNRAEREQQETTVADALGGGAVGATAGVEVPRPEALARAPGRITIASPEIDGSINLQGLLIDDVKLTQFRETLEDGSPEVDVLNPVGANDPFYARLGWAGAGAPNAEDIWSAPAGARLTPTTPVTATLRKEGVLYETRLSIDEHYMITADMRATNETGRSVQLVPIGEVRRFGIPDGFENFMISHEGAVGVVSGKRHLRKYKKLADNPIADQGTGGWAGIAGKYWMGAVIPPQDEVFGARFDQVGSAAAPVYRSAFELPPREIAPGDAADVTVRAFAGAKTVKTLRDYQKSMEKGGLDVMQFDWAVDWGNFFFLTRPIFSVLHFFAELTKNYGVAILLLTLAIKIVLFPLANKGFESMAKMKELQPKVKKLQERYKEDKQKLQQEMMTLYQKEKVNPMAGCLPILVQMPIFYALYKTLYVTIELRHQPFLYIRDLSEQDPTTIFNLFGLLPFDPTVLPLIGPFLGVGILPLLMGVAMWFQTKLNPPAADPMQARIFALLPFIFVFIFAPFAAGLVLYWFWNTFLSVLQQYVIMRRNGVEVNLAENLKLPDAVKKLMPGAKKSEG
ncbi:MAG: membrane protein insertase YidC [Pseudomonadota bacterium]